MSFYRYEIPYTQVVVPLPERPTDRSIWANVIWALVIWTLVLLAFTALTYWALFMGTRYLWRHGKPYYYKAKARYKMHKLNKLRAKLDDPTKKIIDQ